VNVWVGDGAGSYCNLLAHSEFNAETGRLYLDFNRFEENKYTGFDFFVTLDVSAAHTPIPSIAYITGDDVPSRQLWAVMKTPINGTVLYTSLGTIAAFLNENGIYVPLANLKTYNALANPSEGTTVLSVSKIPGTKGSPPRYLLLLLKKKGGMHSMVTYDTFTDEAWRRRQGRAVWRAFCASCGVTAS
jgi:hypothetical protein